MRLKICTEKPLIEDNSNTINNKNVGFTFLLVGALCHISR